MNFLTTHKNAMSPFNSILDDFFGRDAFYELWGDPARYVKNEDGSFEYLADMPGVKKEDVKVELSDGLVTVTAEHKGKIVRSYRKTFSVPYTTKEEDISASMEDGVLTLNISKPPDPKRKLIAVK